MRGYKILADPSVQPSPFTGYINNSGLPIQTGDEFGKSQYDTEQKINPYEIDNINEYRANSQTNLDKIANGASRLLLTSLTKTGEGVGYLSGLVDPANFGDSYISKAADNGFAQMFNNAEESVKNQFPLYNTKSDLSEGLFKRAATDLDFWMDDVVDGVAFTLSTYIPGGILGKLGLGTKLASSNLETLNAFNKALEMTRTGEITLPNLRKLATGIDKTTQFATMTNMEAMFEANDLKKSLKTKLYNDREKGLNDFTDERIEEIVAEKAKNSFIQNLIALAPSNLFEVSALYKGLNKTITPATSKLEGITADLLTGAKAVELNGWKKFANSPIGAGILGTLEHGASEGLYEENIQYSIEKFNKQFGYQGQTDNFLKTSEDILTSLLDPNEYSDKERQKNIFLGSIIGGPTGFVGERREAVNEGKRREQAIKNINSDLTNNKDILKNLYERDDEGKVKFDNNHNPIVSKEGLAKLLADRSQIDELNRIANHDDNKDNILSKIAKDTKFDKIAKSFFNAGLGEDLLRSLKTLHKLSEDELLNLGIDPYEQDAQGNKKSKDSILNHYQDRAKKLESLYNSLEFGILSGTNKADQEVNQVRKEELYHIGAQILTLHEARKEQEHALNKLMLESGNIDPLINEYNTLIEKRNDLEKLPEDTYKQKFLIDKQIALFKEIHNDLFKDQKFEEDGSVNLTNHPLTKAFKLVSLKHSELLNGIDRVTNDWGTLSKPITGEKYRTKIINQLFDIAKGGPLSSTSQYLKHENSIIKDRVYSLNIKNINNEFFKEAIKFRLNDPEDDHLKILNDIIKSKAPLDKETLDYIKDTIQEYLDTLPNFEEQINEIHDNINYMNELGEPIDDLEKQLTDLLNKQKEAFELEQYLKEINKIPIFKEEKINLVSTKESIAKEFTQQNQIIFENERDLGDLYGDQAALDSINHQIDITTKLINIFKERKDSKSFQNLLNTLEKELNDLKSIADKVSKRLADRKAQQETILNNNTELNYNSIGLTRTGETLKDRELLLSIISNIVGDNRFTEILKDIENEERNVIFPEVIKQILRKSDPLKVKNLFDELNRLINLEFNQIFDIQEIKTIYDSNTIIKGINAGQLYVTLYKENPERFFELILNKLSISDDKLRDVVDIYNSHKDIYKFKTDLEKIKKSFPESDVLAKFLDFHLKYLPLKTLEKELSLPSNFDIEKQLLKEKAFNNKEITPSNEQLIAIRELVKFLNVNYPKGIFSNYAYLKGFAGTGKTSVVIKWVMESVKELYGLHNIYTSGHSINSAKTLQGFLTTKDENTGSIETFIDQITNNPDSLKDINLLILDEVGAISSSNLQNLAKSIAKFNETRDTQLKVIMLGDPNQTTADGMNSPIDNVTEFLSNTNEFNSGRGIVTIKPLTIRYRSNVSSIVELQDKFLNQSKDLTEESFTLKVNTDDFSSDELLGTYGVKTIGEFKDKLIELLKLRDKFTSTKAVIVSSNYVNEFKNLLLSNGFNTIEVLTPNQSQGRTIDEVYTFITPGNKLDNPVSIKNYNKEVYTATSRATKFLMLGNFDTVNTVNNDSIQSNKEIQEKELKEAKDLFTKNNIIDYTQANKHLKDTIDDEEEELPEEKEEEQEEDGIIVSDEEDDDIADIPEYGTFTPVTPPKPNDPPRHILDYTKQSSLKLKDEDGNQIVNPGDEVYYIVVKDISDPENNHVKVVKLLKDGDFIEIGRLSPEELNNPSDELKSIFNDLSNKLTNDNIPTSIKNNKIINIENGIKAQIVYAQKLTYLYDDKYETGLWADIKKRILSIFVNRMNTYGAGLQPLDNQGVIKVFTNKQIKELSNAGKLGDYTPIAGIPYLFIESPIQNNSIKNKFGNVISQFIQLSRKKLNVQKHNYITDPIKELLNNVKIFNSLSELHFGTELGNLYINYIRHAVDSDLISPKKTWDSVREVWKNTPKEQQVKLKDVINKIDGLIYKEASLEVGHKVKRKNDIPFQIKTKADKIIDITLELYGFDQDKKNVLLKVPKNFINTDNLQIGKSKENVEFIQLPIDDISPTKRSAGAAQAAFNHIAGGNLDLRYNGKVQKILRSYRRTKDKKNLITGKSLLADTKPKNLLRPQNNTVLSRSLVKFLKFKGYTKKDAETETLDVLKINNPELYKEFKETSMAAIQDYFINQQDLEAIVSGDNEGNSNTNLRVPLDQDFGNDRWINKFMHSTGVKQDVGDYIESNFKDIIPTTIITHFPTTPINNTITTPVSNPVKKKAPKLLEKKYNTAETLGKLLSSNEVLNYLKTKIKEFKDSDVRFIDDIQMIKLSEGKEAWGLYKNGIIYLLKNGNDEVYSQVIKHELFHKIFNQHLSKKEQQKALSFIKKIHGNISNIEAEEILARKYQIYEKNNQQKGVLKTIFDKIKKFLSFWFRNFNTVNELFDKIEDNYFKKPVNDNFKGSRFLSRIKEDWGNIDSFINGKNYFINSLENYIKNYEDIDNDSNFPITRNEAVHQIFEDIKNRFNEINEYLYNYAGTKEEGLKAFTDTEFEYNNFEILAKEYEAVKLLRNINTYKRLVEDFYPTIKFKKSIDGNFIIEEEFSPEELQLQVDEALESGSLYQDHIQEADQVNHELKLSIAAKDFLSLIRNKQEKLVNHKYAFVLIVDKLQSQNFNNIAKIKIEIEEQWKNLKHPDQIAIKEALLNLIELATSGTNNKGFPLPTDKFFTNHNTFQTDLTGKKFIHKNELSTKEFLIKINKATNIDLNTLKALFIKMDANNTLAELISTTGSLIKKDVRYGLKDKNLAYLPIYKYNSMSENSLRDVIKNQIEIALLNNLERLFNTQIATKIYNWKTGDVNGIEIINSLIAYLGFEGDFDINNVQATTVIGDFQALFLYITSNRKEEDFNLEALIEDSSNRLDNFTDVLMTAATDNTVTSYRSGDGTKRWFYTLSSQAHDILNSFYKGKTDRIIPFLSSYLYANNIFNNEITKTPLNTIHNIINHDSMKTKDSDYNTTYSSESSKQWYERNILYGFSAYLKTYKTKKDKKTYVQQFWTISNKPSPQAAEINLLNYNEINEGLKQAILSEVNRPDIQHVNFDRNHTSVPGLTSEDIKSLRADKESLTGTVDIDQLIKDKVLPAIEQERDRILNTIINQRVVFDSETHYIYSQIKDYYKDSPFTEEDLKASALAVSETQNFKKYKDNAETIKKEITPLVDLFVKNYIVNSYHLNRLIAGDEAFYEGLFDITKRMSIVFATGTKPVVNNKNFTDETYKVAVGKDIRTTLGDEKYKKFEKLYGNTFDSSDGAGFMTSKRANNIRKGFGQAMQLGGIFKPIYFGINEQGIPTAVKYACVELTQDLLDQFPELKALNERMEANNIGEYLFESAVKVGAPVKLSEWGKDIDPASILELNNNNYRIQLNKSHEAYDEVALPTQLMYFINSDGNNLEEALKIYELQADLIELGINKALKAINWKSNPKLSTNLDISKAKVAIRKLVMQSLEGLQGSEREWEFLNSGISLNFPTIVNKVVTQFTSQMSKSMVKIDFAGGGLVLQTDVGTYSTYDKDGKVQTNQKLKLHVTDDTYYVDCYVSEELAKYVNKDGYLLGFRMPSTEKHSAVPLKVKGFLKGNKNTIIVADDIVNLHGSDFDIDVLYALAMDNSRDKNGELTVEAEIKNEIVNRLIKVFTDPKNIQEMLTPITMDVFKSMDKVDGQESVFTMLARLKGYTGDKEKERKDILYKQNNVNFPSTQNQMHQDNFTGAKLVGAFANIPKSVNYLIVSSESNDGSLPQLHEDEIAEDGEITKKGNYLELNGKKYTGIVRTNEDGIPIRQITDSFINAAIDAVKEQILNLINATNNTGNALMAMLNVGIGLNKTVIFMLQPSIMEINNHINVDTGINIIKSKIRELIKSKEEKNPENFNYKELVINTNELEKNIYKSLEELSLSDLNMQLRVLDEFDKANEIGKALFTTSKALKVIQSFPVIFEEIQDLLDEWKKIISFDHGDFIVEDNNFKLNNNFQFTNTNLTNIPHIKLAFKQLINQKTRIERLTFKHNEHLQKFAFRIKELANKIKIAKTDNASLRLIREEFIKYLISDIKYAYNDIKYDLNTANETPITIKNSKGESISLSGTEAWNQKFIDKLTNLRKEEKNLFLNNLEFAINYTTRTKEIRFRSLNRLSPEMVNKYSAEFDKLDEVTKQEFVKYSALNQGLNFSTSTYTLLIDPKYFIDIDNAINNKFNNLINSNKESNQQQNDLDNYLENFALQLAGNYADKLKSLPDKLLRGEVKNPETGYNKEANTYFNLSFNLNVKGDDLESNDEETIKGFKKFEDFPLFITNKYRDKLYIKLPDTANDVVYYQLVDRLKTFKIYQTNSDIEKGLYKLNNVFRNNLLVLKLRSIIDKDNNTIKEFTVNYKVVDDNKLEPGVIIGIRSSSDLSRINMKEMRILAIENVEDINNKKLVVEEIKQVEETKLGSDTETIESLSKEKIDLEKKVKTANAKDKFGLRKLITEIQQKINALKKELNITKPELKADTSLDKVKILIDKLSKKFNIAYEIVSAEEAESKKKEINPQSTDTIETISHFYYKGKVIFVESKLNTEAAFHEFSHPFIQAIRNTNPKLFENLYEEAIKKNKTLESYITNLYPELVNTLQFKEEAIVTVLGRIAKKDNYAAQNNLRTWVTSLLKECCRIIKDILNVRDPIKVSDLKDGSISLQELSLLIHEDLSINLEDKFDKDNIMHMRTPGELSNLIANKNSNIDLPDNSVVGSKYKRGVRLYDRVTEFVTNTFSTYKYSTSIEKADRAFKRRNLNKATDKIKSIVVNNIEQDFTYNEYVTLLSIQDNTNIVRGKILHLMLQKITNLANNSLTDEEKQLIIIELDFQINELAVAKENIQNAIDVSTEFNWLFDTDGTDEESEINRKNIYSMLMKLGMNLFSGDVTEESERDKVKAELPIVSDALKLGTTLDNLFEHSDGTLGMIDWKYSTLTNFIKSNRTMLFAKDLDIEDNSVNHYMLEMAIRALIIKEQFPEAKFRELKVVGLKKSVGFENNDVDLSKMLALLKEYYKKTDIKLHDELNSRNLFDASEYWSQSKYFVESKIVNSTTLTNEEKVQALLDEAKYKYNNGNPNSSEDAKEVKRIVLLINELKGTSGDNINELLQKALKEELGDLGWFKRWFGNKYSIDNKFINTVTDFAGSRKQKARNRILKIMKQGDHLLEAVIKEYMQNNGLKSTLNTLTLGKINLIKYASKDLKGSGLYDFMWKQHDNGVDKTGSYANLEFDKMTKAQREYAEFYRNQINDLDKLLDEVIYVRNGVQKTIRDLAGVQKLTEDFMPRLPKKADESVENDGLTAPISWFKYKYEDFVDSFRQPKDYGRSKNAGIPIKYRGNSEIIEKGEHTFNAHIALHAYVTNMIMKNEMDDVYTLAQATGSVFEGLKKDGKMVWKNNKAFLDDFVKLNVLDVKDDSKFSKKTIKLYKKSIKKDKNGKEIIPDTEYYELNLDTFFKNLKSWTSATSMWLQPIAGGFNSVLIFMLNHKDAFKGSIAKKLGVPESDINFSFSDMVWADKEYAKYQGMTMGGFNTKAVENNKLYLMLKELNYMPDAYDYKIKKSELKGGKNSLFDESHLYVFHAIGEEYGSITMLLAQLRHLKNPNTGKSIWDSYKVENGNLIWDGGVRFNRLNSDKTTTEVKGLTDEEINRLKRVNSLLQGGYRDDERTALELHALGQWVLQFKKFLPSQLENLFQSKYDDKSLGKWVETKQKDLNGKNLYEWQAMVNEGRIWVMMKTLAYYATRSKTNDAYKWENLSSLQKQGIIDTTVTLIFLLMSLIAFDSDDDKRFTKQQRTWRIRTRRLIEDLTQGTDPRDILRSITTQTIVLPKLMKTIDAFGQYVTSHGEKGTTELRKSIPIINSQYNWERYIGGEKPLR